MRKSIVESKGKEIRLAIKYNNYGGNGVCSICRAETSARVSLELFFNEGYREVCGECGKKYAPDLYWLLEIFYLLHGDACMFLDPELKPFKSLRNFLQTICGLQELMERDSQRNVGDAPF